MNKIPRKARKLQIQFLISTCSNKAGEIMVANKTDDGWIGEDKSGKKWFLFLSLIRNSNVCTVNVLE